MAFDAFTHNEIMEVLEEVRPHRNFLLQWFSGILNFTDENVNFDKIPGDYRLAPFVAPKIRGKVVRKKGGQVKVYQPGYIKDKDTVEPNQILKRRAGEKIGAQLTPQERYMAAVVQQADDMRTRWLRRLEWMAAQFILTGSYDMESAEHPKVSVDFERAAGNTLDFTTLNANGGVGKRAWGSTGGTNTVSPIDDLEEFLNLCLEPVRDVIMSQDAWAEFRKDPKFEKLIDNTLRNASASSFEMGPQVADLTGVIYRGYLASTGTRIWTYTAQYADITSGTMTNYIPAGYVVGLPDPSFGWQCFGAIMDANAEFQSVDMFYRMWMEDDPGMPWMMLQSAPMLAHTKINSTFAVKVK